MKLDFSIKECMVEWASKFMQCESKVGRAGEF